MARNDYYSDAIAESFHQASGFGWGRWFLIFNVPKLVREIAESVAISVENESTFSGRDCIPNPLESEVNRQKKYRAEDAKDFDKQRIQHEREKEDLHRTIRNLRWELERAKA